MIIDTAVNKLFFPTKNFFFPKKKFQTPADFYTHLGHMCVQCIEGIPTRLLFLIPRVWKQDIERGEPPSKGGDNSRRSTNGSVDVGSAAAQPGVPTTAGSSPSTCRTIARTFQRIVLAMIAVGLLGGLVALVWIFMGPIFVLQLVLVVIVAYFVSGGRLRWFYIAFKTAPRDLTWVICSVNFF